MLADIIFSGRNILEPSSWPSIQDTEQYFAETFESISSVDNAPILDPQTSEHTSQPITPEEVGKANTSWKKSVPDSDGVTTEQVRQTSDRQLALIFTVILYSNTQLDRFKTSRITLIYKKSEKADPSNWRPITVSSTVLHLFHRVLANRLRTQVALNANQ